MALTIEDLDRRVSAPEKAQNDTTVTLRWVVGTLGQMQAVLDEHTLQLRRLQTVQDERTAQLRQIVGDLAALRRDLPAMVADAVRDGLRGT